jgi:serine/threonine protein kinase/formylglycine-generating enzyme required for sulfatase activity
MNLTNWVLDQEVTFFLDRQKLLQAVEFPQHLSQFVDKHAADDPVRRFTLLAHLVRSDLTLSLDNGPARKAVDYLKAFPELTASPTLVADLIHVEANFVAGGDPLKMWQFLRELPSFYRDVLANYGPYPRYELGEQIEPGGQGTVWRATDRELQREVAVKTPHQVNDASVQDLLQEACLTSELEHPVIVPVYGAMLSHELGVCYAMQYVDLDRLDTSIQELHSPNEPTPDRQTLLRRIITQLVAIARAIEYAHERRVLHLDLKPGNILVGKYGETMLIDWGVARRMSASPEAFRKAGGTLPYMSPEQAQLMLVPGDAAPPAGTIPLDNRADIYSLGATLYHVLANRPPFVPETDETQERFIKRVAAGSPQPVSVVAPRADRTLAAIAAKAMRHEPQDRYDTAETFAQDLDRWSAGEETKALPWSPWERVWKWLHRHLQWVVTGGVGVAVAVALVSFTVHWLDQQHRRQDLKKTIGQLQSMPASEVRSALDEIRAAPPQWSRAELEALIQPIAKPGRLELARLPLDPSLLADLLGSLATVSEPLEYGLIVDVLLKHLRNSANQPNSQSGAAAAESASKAFDNVPPALAKSLRLGLDQLETRLKNSSSSDSRRDSEAVTPLIRIRAATALAVFDPSRNWGDQLTRMADDLVHSDTRWYDELGSRLATVKGLDCQLKTRFLDDSSSMAERTAAAMCLVRLRAGEEHASFLWDLVKRSEPEQLPILLSAAGSFSATAKGDLNNRARVALGAYQDFVGQPWMAKSDQCKADRLAAEAANLALAEWSTDLTRFNASLWERGPDPRLRTELIHRWHAAGFPLGQLLSLITKDRSPGELAALVLAATTYQPSELSDESLQRERKLAELQRRVEPKLDPELMAALEQLAEKWEVPMPQFKRESQSAGQMGWITSTGHHLAPNHRLIVVPAAVANADFEIGAVPGEGFRDHDERRRKARIPRTFAVSSREVTVAQFREFLNAYGKKGHDQRRAAADEMRLLNRGENSPREVQDQDAVCWITMATAAAYCNWLSEAEGLEPCYPSGQLEDFIGADGQGSVSLDEDLLAKSGYRLPTEVESELCLRAGTQSPRSYGYRESYIRKYAVFRFDDQLGPSRPATRLPNPWGLFDTLGNVAEWCHPRPPASESAGEAVFVDSGPVPDWEWDTEGGAILRGGAHNNVVDVLRSAYRLPERWTSRTLDAGFRVVRTLPSQPSPSGKDAQK